MNSHAIAERAGLIRHRNYVAQIKKDPELIKQAREMIERAEKSDAETVGLRLWRLVLNEPVQSIIDYMLNEGEVGQLLRSNSPFSILIGQTDTEQRRNTWQIAAQELSIERTSSALHVQLQPTST